MINKKKVAAIMAVGQFLKNTEEVKNPKVRWNEYGVGWNNQLRTNFKN